MLFKGVGENTELRDEWDTEILSVHPIASAVKNQIEVKQTTGKEKDAQTKHLHTSLPLALKNEWTMWLHYNRGITKEEWDGALSRRAYETKKKKKKNKTTSLSTLRGKGGENARDIEDR